MLWRKVFWISSIIYVACGLFFNLCSSGEIQSWNYSDSNSKKQSVDLGNKTKIKKSFFGLAMSTILDILTMSTVL